MEDRDYRPPTEEEMEEITAGMERWEKSGIFEQMFTGELKPLEGATKEKLLLSFNPDMHLYRNTFLRIYGYTLTDQGFEEIALSKLENLGCSKAREYYNSIIGDYEKSRAKESRILAGWYVGICHKRWEEEIKKIKVVQNCNWKKSNSLMKRSEALKSLIERLQENS